MNLSFSKKIKQLGSLLSTIAIIIISIILVAFVYFRMYRLTEKNCLINLETTAEKVGNLFSSDIQYQSLFLHDYADLIIANKIDEKEEFINFMKNFTFSYNTYDVKMILPDGTIICRGGKTMQITDDQYFFRQAQKGESFSPIKPSFTESMVSIDHYLPVTISGKTVCILFCELDLDFLANEGVESIYDGNADYIIFNPNTREMYVNTYSRLTGNLYAFLTRLIYPKNKVDEIVSACEKLSVYSSEVHSLGEKLYIYVVPLSVENFSICVFGKNNVIFKDLELFKSTAVKFIVIMSVLYSIYLIFMIKNTQERINISIMEERVNKAESEAKYKTIFLSSMSHDIRTPMNAIVGYINLAVLNSSDEIRMKQYLSKSLAASNHLLSLINEVLDISRIESGKITIKETECDLREILSEIENILTVQTQPKKQNFHINSELLTNSYVMCDKLHLQQILINILGNSVKYTQRHGDISLTVKEKLLLSAPGKSSSEYEFSMKDNGIGMSSDFLKHVFEPFSRQKLIEDKVSGTGLGLAICKKLIEHMNGTIEIKSAENVGTETIVKLKFNHISLEQYEKEKYISLNHDSYRIDSKINNSKRNYEGKILLLVDDNDFNREISTELLQRAGFKVEEARNGQEAVEKVKASVPGYYSAVLMDIQMPILNGYEATRFIRDLPDISLSQIPIVAVTANAFEEDIQMAKKEGMNAYIVKPINITKLFTVLDEIFIKKIDNLV
ncbi:ATP-binding protein [Treponema sp. C6A8]|uniref:ATP-binding protein n=1 Tax=Treponema sp. C6A8 TaxID=1410609 RepID=UPI0006884F37|nr:ATP-binding protein [Treponema sp. C6A8]